MRYFLELCLLSVQRSIANIDAEIIVVDNNSTDDSCVMVEQQFPDVQLIKNQKNSGFSKGNNIGVKHAQGQYVCILNPDTVVPEHIFEELLEFAENQKNLGIVGCQLIDGTGSFLPESKRSIPTPKVALAKIFGSTSRYYSNLDMDAVGTTDVLVGAFMIMKTEVYRKVGGFDEDYFMYGEDIDLSYRILKEGFDNYYYGKVSAIHFKGESTLKDKVYAQRFYGSMQLFYKKHHSSNGLLNFLIASGLKLARLLPKSNHTYQKNVEVMTVISNETSKQLEDNFQLKVEYTSSGDAIADKTLAVFDTDYCKFSKIIDTLKVNRQFEDVAYRFWLKDCNFIVGSDTSNRQGEVVKL